MTTVSVVHAKRGLDLRGKPAIGFWDFFGR